MHECASIMELLWVTFGLSLLLHSVGQQKHAACRLNETTTLLPFNFCRQGHRIGDLAFIFIGPAIKE